MLVVCALSAAVYWRGVLHLRRAGQAVSAWQCASFALGLLASYVVLQTYVDYLAQHMFWVHRLQHLVLHHVAPVLLIVGVQGQVLARGMPEGWRAYVRRSHSRLQWLGYVYRVLQHPAVASLLFVGLIYVWLIPEVHFTAMLDARRYRVMNWSMAIDGLLFWWLILTPRRALGRVAVGYGSRVLMLCFVAAVQIFIGAYITFHKSVLFDVYAICGRAWSITPMVDQQLGGLLTWIPPAMMSAIGLLIVLHLLMHDSHRDAVSSGEPRGINCAEAAK